MPIAYKFIDNSTGKAVPLSQIDHEMCELLGIEERQDDFSLEFESTTMLGISAAWDSGECNQQNVYDTMLKAYKGKMPSDRVKNLFDKFLWKDYTFVSWGERGR
jgi:hypothetical protein